MDEQKIESRVKLEELDRVLETILPENCTGRGIMGASIVANACLDAFLQEKGWSRDCIGAVTLFASIIYEGKWQVPSHIHEKGCGCHRRFRSGNRLQIMGRMEDLITEWGLPTKSNPRIEEGVTMYAEAGGSRKYPAVVVKIFKGNDFFQSNSGGTAYFEPTSGQWRLSVFYKDEGRLIPEWFPPISDRTKAIQFITERVLER